MKKRLAVLLAFAALVPIVGAFAGVRRGTGQFDGLVADAAQSTPPAATILRVPGTIDKYEVSTRVLWLSTSNGKVQFPLAAATRILRAGQRIEVSELAKLSGYRAAVRYSESAGHKIVESVHVFGRDQVIAR